MHLPSFVVLFLLLTSASLFSQVSPTIVSSRPEGVVTVSGNLNQGAPLPDLSWAWNSSNACFVQTQARKFTGNHVLFQTDLPSRAEMTIRLVPADPAANFSLYAYSVGPQSPPIVPDLPSCVSCEADYKWDYKVRGKTQDHTRSVQLRAVNNPYTVIIGVVGAAGLAGGSFTLEIALEGGETVEIRPQEPIPFARLSGVEKGKTATFAGDLSQGKPIHDLSWAWNSSNACFVETQKAKFSGNHLLYAVELPPRSTLRVRLVPESKSANLSLYAYSVGVQENPPLPPGLPSCVSCEADFKWDFARAGQTQDHTRSVELRAVNNPYMVVIGVAGATEGSFALEIELE